MNRYSPLRYPGGKGKLAPYLSEVLALNSLEGCHYVEPFAGGAGVALELLASERVSHIHINDLDRCVYAFWQSAVFQTDALIERILNTEVTVENWLKAREVKRAPSRSRLLDLGFATFFLSRTNRSGILNGGVIGGLDQAGKWKIDCRYNKEELVSRIARIGFFRSRITVKNMDATTLMSKYVKKIPKRAFLYIDPPYYVKGAYLYKNHYRHDDHAKLANVISRIKRHKWIVSYDNAPPIRKIYNGYEQQIFDIDYTARSYAKGKEVMIFSPELRHPGKVYTSQREKLQFAAA